MIAFLTAIATAAEAIITPSSTARSSDIVYSPIKPTGSHERENGEVTAAADFIDAALQYEGSEYRAQEDADRFGAALRFYGSSVGAIRGTVRDAARRYPGMSHDEVTALASELWEVPVYERRLAAIVLLQSNARTLIVTDLTRLEGFVRSAGIAALVDPLVGDVIRPLVDGLDGRDRTKADGVLARWKADGDPWLSRAAR
jgi:hypothetical protein